MTQIAKIVDVTRSFLPMDPNSLTDNRMFSEREDSPEKDIPIIAYDGYNFMPTNYGYRSFFGEASILSLARLASRVDKVLLFQLSNFRTILIALCEDGIWASINASTAGATWTQYATYPIPTVGTHYEWTWALIENSLYMYRQGSQEVWKLGYNDWTVVASHIPVSFLTYSPLEATVTGDGTIATPYNISIPTPAAVITFLNYSQVPITLNLLITVVGAANVAMASVFGITSWTLISNTTYPVGANQVSIVVNPNTIYRVTANNAAIGDSVTMAVDATDAAGSDTMLSAVEDVAVSPVWKEVAPSFPTGLGTLASPMSWSSAGPTTEVDIVTSKTPIALYAFITATSASGVITVDEADFAGAIVNTTTNAIASFSNTMISMTPGNELWIYSSGTDIAVTSLIFRTVPSL